MAVGGTETSSLSDVLPTPSSPPADAPVGPGGQAGSGEGGLEEAGLFTRWVSWRIVSASGMWFLGTSEQAQKAPFGKEVLCSADFF